MQSAQIDIADLKDNIQLSKHERIKGILHLDKIETILINEIEYSGKLKMLYDKGSIFDFIIEKKSVELQIAWVNFPPKADVNEFSTIKITAEKIWWENLPELYDPFW